MGRPFLFLAILLLAACGGLPRRDSVDAEALAWDACAPVAVTGKVRAVAYDAGLPQQGQWRDGFALADMNGDGRLDLVHGPARKGGFRPAIFLGDGQGRFSPWSEAHFPPLPFDYGDVAVADLNADSRPDIAVASHLRGLAALIQEAPGHFAPWGEGLELVDLGRAPEAMPFASRAIALADWDGDARVDLLAVNEGPSRWKPNQRVDAMLAVYLDRGGFWERVPIDARWHGFGDAIATGDVDGDGRLDVVQGTQAVGLRNLLWRAKDVPATPLPLRTLPLRAAVTAVELLDVDADGRDEVALAPRTTRDNGFCTGLQLVRSAGGEAEAAQVLWRAPGVDGLVRLASADLNQDGQIDLVGLARRGELRVFLGSPHGLTPAGTIPRTAAMAACDAFDLEIADLDGQPGLEMIVSFAGDNADFSGQIDCPNRGGFQAWHLHADDGR